MSTTTSRLLQLLSLLQTRRDWSGSLLASRLEISARTVRRDIDRLRELGYTIATTMGPDGGYRLEAGSEMPPLLFDDDQAVAITVALQTASGVGIGAEAAIRALATVRQVLPSRLRHRIDVLDVTTIANRAGEAPPPHVSADLLVSLADSIRAQHMLRFDYASPDAVEDADSRPPRRVEPHHLVMSQGRWYLVAWDLDRGDWRIFRADRIHPRIPTGPRFETREVPGGDVADFVSARFKGSDVDEWPCRGTVILDAPASVVLPFAGDGTVRAVDADRCALEAGSWSWEALAASFGRFGVVIEVVEPPELRAAFAALATRYATAAGDATSVAR